MNRAYEAGGEEWRILKLGLGKQEAAEHSMLKLLDQNRDNSDSDSDNRCWGSNKDKNKDI